MLWAAAAGFGGQGAEVSAVLCIIHCIYYFISVIVLPDCCYPVVLFY